MRQHPFGASSQKSGTAVRGPFASPDARLRVVAFLSVLPLLIVFSRLASLHRDAPSISMGEPQAIRSTLESIPARDGRILSADGKILAEDVETFSILLHYRWLETPANPMWLRSEALKQLAPRERRNPQAVALAERNVEERRQALWDRLCEQTKLDRPALLNRFAIIQQQVEKLRQSVIEARSAQSPPATSDHAPKPSMWWEIAFETLRKAVTTPPGKPADEPLILAEEVDLHEIAVDQPISVAAAVEANPDLYPGTQVRVTSRRRYPYGSVAAHLVGYRFEDSDAANDDAETLLTTGQTGIERSYDRHLQGIDGQQRVWLDRHGEPIRTEIVREPRVGSDIILNVNLDLQIETERILDESLKTVRNASAPESPVPADAGGCIAIIDVRNGALLAAASAPRFDLSQAASRSAEFWSHVSVDPRRPLFDRIAAAALPPGSVFKSVSAAAMLESGAIDPDEPFDCRGYLDRPDRHRDYVYRHFGVGHGPTTLTSALAESCNVYFFAGARRIGAAPLLRSASLFGYGSPTGIDVPREASGSLPTSARNADSLGLSIGQATLTATPLQVLRMTAAIANGGRLVMPHAVRGSGPTQAGQSSVKPILHTRQLDELRPDTLRRIREGLAQAVSHPRGTGYKSIRHPQISIAGKTGTAEVGGSLPDHAWFAGYAPADDPQFAVVVLLEHAGSGANAAGPAARQTFDAILRNGLIRR